MDSGPHYIRVIRMCVGEITTVYAASAGLHDDAVESDAHVILSGTHGAVAAMHLVLAPGLTQPTETLWLTGTRGEIVMGDESTVVRREREAERVLAGKGSNSYAEGFVPQLSAFVQAILTGDWTRVPPEEGLRDLAVIEAIYRSLRSGAPESVTRIDSASVAW